MSEYKFLDNGFFMIKEGNELHSPISTINYEYYDNKIFKNLNDLAIQESSKLNRYNLELYITCKKCLK